MKTIDPSPAAHPDSESLGLLLDGLAERIQAGEPVDLEAAVRDHPEHAASLRQLLPALQLLADVAPSASGRPTDGVGDTPGRLGDFLILRELGRGGMGVVYEAEQISLGRRVALKVLPYAATMDARQLQRFKNEARAAASLHHPHIVPVYGVGCERGVHYYAMQLIDGQSLAAMVDELRQGLASGSNGSLVPQDPSGATGASGHPAPTAPVAARTTQKSGREKSHYRRVAELVAQAADALEFAHSTGVVHRDVKPANLILDETGHLWVADFGLARFGADAGLTVSGDLIGTLRYMSPEQALAKHGLVDHRTDVYSLGATLYELLTLRPAVDGEDKQEVLRRIAFEEPTAPRKVDRGIPAELETITLKALAKGPSERYVTAGEFADDLRRWLGDQTIRAKPPTVWQRAAKWARRHRPAVIAAGVLILGSVVALAVGSVLILHEKHRTEERFQAARVAVDDMYTGVAEGWLEDAPRLAEVQRRFLEKALEFYRRFGEDHGGDATVRQDTALAFLRVGHIQAKLGRDDAAEAAYREAIGRLEALAAASPDDSKSRSNLTAAFKAHGQLLLTRRRYPEAESALLRAIDFGRKQVAATPEMPGAWPELAKSHQALGLVYAETGRDRDAAAEYARAIEAWERLATAVPDQPLFVSGLGGALHNLSMVRIDHEPAEADRLLARAIAQQQAALKLDPRRVKTREFLATHGMARGDILMRLGRLAEAVTAYEDTVAQAKRLVDDFPEVPLYREKLVKVTVNWSIALNATGRHLEAVNVVRTARDVGQKLVDEYPSAPNYQRVLLAALQNLMADIGDLQAHNGSADADADLSREAERAGRQAVETLERLLVSNPTDPKLQSSLGGTLNNLAARLVQRGENLEEALALLRRAVVFQREALKARPDDPQIRKFLRNHGTRLMAAHQRLVEQHHRAGRTAAADAAWVHARSHAEELLAEYPDDPDVCGTVAWFRASGPKFAAGDAEQAVELAKKAAPAAKHYHLYRQTLGVAYYRVGNWKDAVATLDVPVPPDRLSSGPTRFFLAMAYWQLGDHQRARELYAGAGMWMEKHKPNDDELYRFREEATTLIGPTVPRPFP